MFFRFFNSLLLAGTSLANLIKISGNSNMLATFQATFVLILSLFLF